MQIYLYSGQRRGIAGRQSDESRIEVFFLDVSYDAQVVRGEGDGLGAAESLPDALLDFFEWEVGIILEQADALSHAFHAVL